MNTRIRLALLAALVAVGIIAGTSATASTTVPVTSHATATTPIQHIVVLMMENHSFDSELGDWCNGAGAGRCLINGVNTGIPTGPVTLSDGSQVTPSVSPDIVPVANHSVTSQSAAINGGAMNGWENVGGCAAPAYSCVSYFPATSVPNLVNLAGSFTVLDQAFTQFDAPSMVGHLQEIAGTNDGFTNNAYWQPGVVHGNRDWGCDSNMVAQRVGAPFVKPQAACVPDYALDPVQYPNGGAFKPTNVAQVPTVLDQMTGAGVSWNIFGAKPSDSGGAFWSACPLAASCLDTSEFANVHELGDFFPAAQAGTLPSVSLVFPEGTFMQGTTKRFGGTFSQHNSQSNSAGDNFLGLVASAVMNSPEWSSTALVITWDDCGCFYDGVAPPVGPDGQQMGTRVPFLLISPFASPVTDATATSSTGSILAFIDAAFGLPALNNNVAGADNLMGDLKFSQSTKTPRMVWRHLPASAYRAAPSTLSDPT